MYSDISKCVSGIKQKHIKKSKSKKKDEGYFLRSCLPSSRIDILCHTNHPHYYNPYMFCYTRWNSSVRRNQRDILIVNAFYP